MSAEAMVRIELTCLALQASTYPLGHIARLTQIQAATLFHLGHWHQISGLEFH